jgi:hypothetical protein
MFFKLLVLTQLFKVAALSTPFSKALSSLKSYEGPQIYQKFRELSVFKNKEGAIRKTLEPIQANGHKVIMVAHKQQTSVIVLGGNQSLNFPIPSKIAMDLSRELKIPYYHHVLEALIGVPLKYQYVLKLSLKNDDDLMVGSKRLITESEISFDQFVEYDKEEDNLPKISGWQALTHFFYLLSTWEHEYFLMEGSHGNYALFWKSNLHRDLDESEKILAYVYFPASMYSHLSYDLAVNMPGIIDLSALRMNSTENSDFYLNISKHIDTTINELRQRYGPKIKPIYFVTAYPKDS